MLRAKQLKPVLAQALGSGITTVLLMTKEGALLGSAQTEPSDTTVAAISSSIYTSYEQSAPSVGSEHLGCVMVECDDGLVGVGRVAHMLVCVAAEPNTPMGLLKRKVDTLGAALAEPLGRMEQ